MAALVRDDLRALGFTEAEIVPTAGHPGVWGYYDAGAPKTLLVYMMYDVQPVNDADWQSPPFEARLVKNALGTVLVGRGAVNQKGPERAFLNAVSAIVAADGRLPINLMIAAEGEEEQGSPHFGEVVTAHEARMRSAVGTLFPMCSQEPDGRAGMDLGVKGILYLQIECRGGPKGGPSRHEVHGSTKAVLDSPAWRLVQALASLTSPDGNTITVPGYYDDIRPPTAEERMLFHNSLDEFQEAQTKTALGAARWVDGLDGTPRPRRTAVQHHAQHRRHLVRLQRRGDEDDPPARRLRQGRLAARAQPDARARAGAHPVSPRCPGLRRCGRDEVGRVPAGADLGRRLRWCSAASRS